MELSTPESHDRITSEYRSCFYISQFNIVKLEALLLDSLKDIKSLIPEFALPLIDLPNQKLESTF